MQYLMWETHLILKPQYKYETKEIRRWSNQMLQNTEKTQWNQCQHA